MNPHLYLLSFLLLFTIELHAQFSPTLWYKADQLHVNATYWESSGSNTTKATSNARLAYGEWINYNPTLSFLQIIDSLQINYDISEQDHISAFVVFRNDSSSQEKSIWGSTSFSTRKLLVSNKNIYDEKQQMNYLFGSGACPVIAAVHKSWEKQVEVDTCALFLGGILSPLHERFDGDIAEFILYDAPLDDQEYASLESYLSIKYGIGVLSCDYQNPAGEVVWSQSDNSDYPMGIFGLARYDNIGLHQKQSTNHYGILSVCVEDFFESNLANTGALMNNSYVLISNNGNNPDVDISISDGAWGGSKLLNALRWKINGTNCTLNQSELIFKINRHDLFTDTISDINMIIDGLGDDSYQEIIRVAPSREDANGDLYFSGMDWGSWGLASAYFTFALVSNIDAELTYETPICENDTSHIKVNVLGGTGPYTAKVISESGALMQQNSYSDSRFEIAIDSLGTYLFDISDVHQNRIRYSSESALKDYTPIKVIENDYIFFEGSMPMITPKPSGEFDISYCEWYFDDQLQSTAFTFQPQENGFYKLIYGISDGCEFETTFSVLDLGNKEDGDGDGDSTDQDNTEEGGESEEDNDIEDETQEGVDTSVNETDLEKQGIRLYPNPSQSGDFTIDLTLERPCELEILAYTMDGKLIHNQEILQAHSGLYGGRITQRGIFLIVIKIDGKLYYQSKFVHLR